MHVTVSAKAALGALKVVVATPHVSQSARGGRVMLPAVPVAVFHPSVADEALPLA